jgi:hypothetical protein
LTADELAWVLSVSRITFKQAKAAGPMYGLTRRQPQIGSGCSELRF